MSAFTVDPAAQAADATDSRTLADDERRTNFLARTWGFNTVYVPVFVLSLLLLNKLLDRPVFQIWAAAYAGFLIVRWVLRRREARLAILSRPMRFASDAIVPVNAALLGALAPLVHAAVPAADFLLLTLLMVVAVALLAFGPIETPRIIPSYVLLLVAPFAVCWLLTDYPYRWVVVAGLALFVVQSFVGGADLIRRARDRARLQAQVQRLSETLAGQVETLLQRNRSQTRMLAAACHDLRQPSHAMGFLLQSLLQAPPEDVAKRVRGLMHSHAALIGMLDMVMDLTQLAEGNFQAAPRPVSLGCLLDDLRAQFAPQAARKGLRFEVDASDAAVLSDPYLLRRIVSNLLSNAVKYTNEGSVELRVARRGSHMVLSVTDTGVGIAPHQQSRVFEEYARLDPSAEGLGIGLSVVKRGCDLLDHALTLQSTPGGGTCVRIELALAPARADEGEPDPDAGPDLPAATAGPIVVAMAEDDDDIAAAAADVMRSWGWHVIPAPDADTLIARLRASRHAPQVLMSDFNLERGDNGFELIARVRALPGLAGLPAILLTGDLRAHVSEQARRDGVRLIHKPVQPSKLRETIVDMVRSPG